MNNVEFKIEINAPAKQVWFALWDDHHYRHWVSVFCEGSYAESDWKEGSAIRFLGPDGGGMYSTITKLVPEEAMCFTHLGELKNNEEQAIDEKTSLWSGATENYYLNEKDGTTTLTVKMDITDEHLSYFQDAFPKGLAKVKEQAENLYIHIAARIEAPLSDVWTFWTSPEHIVKWNQASDDWHTTKSENDLRPGGMFMARMEAKDGSFGFDLKGTYTDVKEHELIKYALEDDRKVEVHFREQDSVCIVEQAFEPENMHSYDLQLGGWQAILNSFKKYSETAKSTANS